MKLEKSLETCLFFFFFNFVLVLAKWIDFLNEVYRLWFIKIFFQKFSRFKVF